MTRRSAVSEQVARDGVRVIECSIPEGMTIAEWRRHRSRRGRRHLAVVPDAASVPEPSCDHVHDTTTRYDRAAKLLSFLLVCPVCATEKVVETVPYEPRFEPAPPARLAA